MVEGGRALTYNITDAAFRAVLGPSVMVRRRGILKTVARIRLTAKEMFMLTGIVGAEAVIGLEDPFRGTLAEEMPREIARVEQDLQAKGLIVMEDGEPVLAEELLEYIEICSRTLFTVRLQSGGPGGGSDERFLYYSAPLVVQAKIETREGERKYVLEGLGSPSEAWMKIVAYMKPAHKSNRHAAELALPAGWLDSWLDGADMDPKPATFLLERGYPEGAVSELARAVEAPERLAAFTAYYRPDGKWRVQGVRVLEGPGSLWLVRGERDREHLSPVSPADLVRHLSAVIERIK